MKFTPEESKLIDRAINTEMSWKWKRWVMAIGGLALAFGDLYTEGFELSHPLTHCNLFFLIGAYFFLVTISRWKGDPRDKLLAKLVEQQAVKPNDEGPGEREQTT